MKKFLLALAICSLIVFALVTTVMADNGPHGSFAADTAACAGCHRVHTAVGSKVSGSSQTIAPAVPPFAAGVEPASSPSRNFRS